MLTSDDLATKSAFIKEVYPQKLTEHDKIGQMSQRVKGLFLVSNMIADDVSVYR